MKFSDLLYGVDVKKWGGDPETEIRQVSSDSRGILKGGLFVCIKGTKKDGHDYIKDAVSRGAEAFVVSDTVNVPDGACYALVENTRLAEAHIWNNWYGRPTENMKTVAVTGTNGKTSTAFVLREIFRTAGYKTGVITTVKCMAGEETLGSLSGSSVLDAVGAMTTPDPEYFYALAYLMKQKGVTVLIFEATSHALAQYKIDPVKVDAALFTNLTTDHLDFHGSLEEYFKAKARLAHLAKNIIVNADDEYMLRLKSEFDSKTITCSAKAEKSNVRALNVRLCGMNGVEYVYFSEKAVFKVGCPLAGRYTVYNSMLSAAAAMSLGVPPEDVRSGLSNVRPIDGRLEEVMLPDEPLPFKVFIDFAHTPDALENLLLTVREAVGKAGKITVLFGCGGDRDRSKRSKMGEIASSLADFVIITSDNSRSEDPRAIIEDILEGIKSKTPHEVIESRREAIHFAIDRATTGETVLLVGKGHEKYEITREGKLPFDEIEIAREAMIKRSGKFTEQ